MKHSTIKKLDKNYHALINREIKTVNNFGIWYMNGAIGKVCDNKDNDFLVVNFAFGKKLIKVSDISYIFPYQNEENKEAEKHRIKANTIRAYRMTIVKEMNRHSAEMKHIKGLKGLYGI